MNPIDLTKHELSKSINSHQRELNMKNTFRQREDRPDLIEPSPKKKRARNSKQHMDYMQRNLADIQKEQIELKKLGVANDLIKSRIQDEENLLKQTERFPFGKENVEISEDVLERYRANYIEQSRVLEKFRVEAQLMRKTGRIKGSKGRTMDWSYIDDVDNRQKELELKRMRETIQQKYEDERNFQRQQKKNLDRIAQTLSGLSLQLHNNSYTLEKGIRDLHSQLQRSTPQPPTFPKPKHTPGQLKTFQQSSKKLPIIVYKSTPHDARIYFSDVYKCNQRIKKQENPSTTREQYKYIVNVLQENNRRLRYLDKLSHWETSDFQKSTCL